MPFHKSDYCDWLLVYEGSESQSYRARQSSLNRLVVIKENIHHDVERFKKEAHARAPLSHPHINKVIEYGTDGGHYFIVSEYVSGIALRKLPILTELQVAEMFESIVKGVAYIHSQGMVHCDLKPDNIIVDAQLQPVIIDFGMIAQIGDPIKKMVEGTAHYLSPEQIVGQALTGQSDIHALGALLYWMLTGEEYFKGDSFERIVNEIRTVKRDFRKVVRHWHMILSRCLAITPEDRYEDADELLECIEIVKNVINQKSNFAQTSSDKISLMEQIKKESAQETSLLIVAEAERLYAAGNYRATYQYLKSEMTYVSENERALTLLVLAGQGLNGHASSRSLKKYVFIVVSIFLVLALAFGILVYMQSPLIERVGEGSVINKESAGSYDKRVEKLREQLRKKTGTRSEDTLLIIPGTHPGDTLYEENIDEN